MNNPFQHLYDKCNTGSSEYKYNTLESEPIIIDIEPVGLCNFRCVMCPTGLSALGRPGGFMSIDTHDAILAKTEHTALRYIGWGEPLMHTQIDKFIRDANRCGRLTHLNTNGSKLTRQLAADLVMAGLSSIKFSFQGVDRESYLHMRRIDFFNELIDAIRMMHEARTPFGNPYIAVSTTTTTETKDQIEQFKDIVSPIADQISIGKTIFEFIDMAAVSKKRRIELEEAAQMSTVVKRHPTPCTEVYDKLTIHWDGAVRVCCNDYSGTTLLGNINTDSIESIWRHPAIEDYRKRIARKEYTGKLCTSCYDYMELTDV